MDNFLRQLCIRKLLEEHELYKVKVTTLVRTESMLQTCKNKNASSLLECDPWMNKIWFSQCDGFFIQPPKGLTTEHGTSISPHFITIPFMSSRFHRIRHSQYPIDFFLFQYPIRANSSLYAFDPFRAKCASRAGCSYHSSPLHSTFHLMALPFEWPGFFPD